MEVVKPARAALVFLCGALFYGASCLLWPQSPPNKPAKQFAGAGGDYKEYDPATLERGKRTYTANCAFCHGGNAKGGESGPDLLRSITVLHDENG
jgi:mono/diheme cytochrome c family protein